MAERVIHDDTLGPLTWNESLDWWEGQAELSPGHPIRFSVTVEHEDELTEEEIGHARRLLLRKKVRFGCATFFNDVLFRSGRDRRFDC